MANYVIGIDVGTTGSKAMVFDLAGNLIGKGYREYKLSEPKPNWVEVGAKFLEDITFEAVQDAVKDSKVEPKEISAIGFSVQRSTFCLVDENLKAIDDKFYVWLDSRAESVMKEIDEKISPQRRSEISGLPGANIFAIAKYYWIKKNEPQTYAKTKYFSTVESYMQHAFGADNFAVEISNGTVTGIMDVATLGWNKEIADKLGFDMAKFPPLVKPGEVVGTVSESVAKKTGLVAGTKIVAGSGDQQCGAMGAGVIRDGALSLTIGTYGQLTVGLAKPDFRSLYGLMMPTTPALGVFQMEGAQVSGAVCYRWLRDTLCEDEIEEAKQKGIDPYELMTEKYIKKSPPGSNGVLFYSALFGSGYPTWDTNATGMFLGLRNAHTKADMVRAVMEGVTLEARNILESALATGVKAEKVITVTGGASKSKEWCQIIADILNLKVRTLDVPDATVLAAAGLAAIGAGIYKNIDEVVAKMIRFGDTYEPISANVKVYNKTFEVYKAAYEGLKSKDVFVKLAELRP